MLGTLSSRTLLQADAYVLSEEFITGEHVNIITVDFETYYSKEYSLSKQTTEEYIRDKRFEVIGVSVKVGSDETEWASGTHKQLKEYLQSFDFENAMVLAHNTMFDGAILNWVFGIRAKVYLDTLSMARALHGINVGNSLAKLATRYKLGQKGTAILNAIGKRRDDFTAEELSEYGDYCINDTDLTFNLFNEMLRRYQFPRDEMKVIDTTLRMFIDPVLELDPELLAEHLKREQLRKEELLESSGVTREDLMSNNKFAELLRAFRVKPPTKISLRTEKETYAFAKTDTEFVALQEHPDPNVQALVAARLGTKSTIEESRTERFIEISRRGTLPIPLKYYAAHTGRWGGDDKVNLQNLPSRGDDTRKTLKRSIMAPPGYTLIDCDSSQIEARVLVWFAGQEDVLQAFRNNDPVYEQMAADIYNKSVEDVTKDERFVGKSTILGAGYGMGAVRFQDQLSTFGYSLDLDECKHVIRVYRTTKPAVTQLWRDAGDMLSAMVSNTPFQLGPEGVISIVPKDNAIILPSGLPLRYDNLGYDDGEFHYDSRQGRNKIYGGKVVENVIQALARCIVAWQMVEIAKWYRVVMTVHDSVVACVREEDAEQARQHIENIMRTPPAWAKGVPLNCESGMARRYGDC